MAATYNYVASFANDRGRADIDGIGKCGRSRVIERFALSRRLHVHLCAETGFPPPFLYRFPQNLFPKLFDKTHPEITVRLAESSDQALMADHFKDATKIGDSTNMEMQADKDAARDRTSIHLIHKLSNNFGMCKLKLGATSPVFTTTFGTTCCNFEQGTVQSNDPVLMAVMAGTVRLHKNLNYSISSSREASVPESRVYCTRQKKMESDIVVNFRQIVGP
ncbi:hypothetical protein R3P38DRAFT_2805943 [Favolaschia claudopus]|uniref:Uncharacterized protein n=1 Tax=Favolaschia claudopus TaxID=2862362 RepID=A0AAV9ZM49_9AGAR